VTENHTPGGSVPIPPWVLHPGEEYKNAWDAHGDHYISAVWRPFWDNLNEHERGAYLERFPPTCGWDGFLQAVAFDQEVVRIDAEDIASGILQPNGLPWPEVAKAKPPWLRYFPRPWLRVPSK